MTERVFFALFIISWSAAILQLWLKFELPAGTQWLEGLWMLLAAAVSLATLARRLPLQNVVMAGLFIGVISAAVATLGAISGVPFGGHTYTDALGPRIFNTLPWPVPFLWMAFIVSSREVARLILRPWRKSNGYGFWLLGITCLLVMILNWGLEPFAVDIKRYWFWHAPSSALRWHETPCASFFGWLLTTLGILLFTSPWFLNKRASRHGLDFHPLILWLLLNLLLLIGNLLHGFWLTAAGELLGMVVVAVWAIRGAKW